MAGPSATTTACGRNSCWPRNTAVTEAKRSASARTRWVQSLLSQPIGRRTEWCAMTGRTFPAATVTVSSLPFTVHGIGRPTPKVATTSFFSHSKATTRRALARYSPTVLREQRRLLKAPPIVRLDWRSDPTGHSTFLKTFTDEFIESSTRAIPPAQHPRAPHARAFLLLLARSFHRPHSRPRVIPDGEPRPKQYRSPMPPMGGAQLSDTQASALAAYVWGLSHPASK